MTAFALVLAVNMFVVAYVSSEQYVYYWDWSLYWIGFTQLGEMFRHNAAQAMVFVSRSVRTDDYNLLPVLPLVPFELVGGASRLSYILAIANVAVIPCAALIAFLPERMAAHRSQVRFLLSTAVVLTLPPLWEPALRGLPDVLGVAILCAILLTYFRRPIDQQGPADSIRLGILLCLLVLTRRWYMFWAVTFFPAAIAAHLSADLPGRIRSEGLQSLAKFLALAGLVFLMLLLAFAAPFVMRIVTSDYRGAFLAYRSDLSLVGQVIAHFGLALLAVATAGLGWLVAKPSTRGLAILLIIQCAASLLLFTQVQPFLGVQHFYLLIPAVGIGVVAAIHAATDARLPLLLRAGGTTAIAGIALLTSFSVLSAKPLGPGPVLPSATYPPLVRTDMEEVERMVDRLVQLKPRQVYVVASSDVLNWSIVRMACVKRHSGACASIAVTHDIDSRDGFPDQLTDTDCVVLATPTQYHVQPGDQRVIGLVARDIRAQRGIGRSFAPLPDEYHLEHGVLAQIYWRTTPVAPADLKALRHEFSRRQPGDQLAKSGTERVTAAH